MTQEQANTYRAQSWLRVWGVAEQTAFLVKQNIYRDTEVTESLIC